MSSSRRLGSEKSATRAAILKAAIQVLEKHGAAGLTAAQIGHEAGLKPHLVHYYFRTMDDLIIALVRTAGREGLKNIARAIASDEPLRAMWDIEDDSKWAVVAMEFGALAAHREPVRAELARYVEEMRSLSTEAIARHFQLRGFESPFPPITITLMIIAIARHLVREKVLGVTSGHRELVAVVDELLSKAPAGPKKRASRAPRKRPSSRLKTAARASRRSRK